jgi:hypothetical protein
MKDTILIRTTSAAKEATLIYPAKIANISKAHHSKQSIEAPGIPIFKYALHYWKVALLIEARVYSKSLCLMRM